MERPPRAPRPWGPGGSSLDGIQSPSWQPPRPPPPTCSPSCPCSPALVTSGHSPSPWPASAWTLSETFPCLRPQGHHSPSLSASPQRHVGTLFPALVVGRQRWRVREVGTPSPASPGGSDVRAQPAIPGSDFRGRASSQILPLLVPFLGWTQIPRGEITCVLTSGVPTPAPGIRQATQTAGASVSTPVEWGGPPTWQGSCEGLRR